VDRNRGARDQAGPELRGADAVATEDDDLLGSRAAIRDRDRRRHHRDGDGEREQQTCQERVALERESQFATAQER
jgi:hypothetical protein